MKSQPSATKTALIFIGLLIVIFIGIFVLKVEPHIPLLSAVVVLVVISKILGYSWDVVERGLINGIAMGIKPIIILALVGVVIAAWMQSGTVPTLLDYGFRFISPQWYFLSALFITILVSTFTGSSFTTIGTIGVALMGVGVGLGVNPAIAAGAIISGACFGDKMSPLSDTTNFAPGVVSVDIFSHIRHMFWTTIPGLIITIIILCFYGFSDQNAHSLDNIAKASETLNQYFNLSVWTLLSPLIVMILAFKRFPTIPTLIIGILSAIFTGSITQADLTAVHWYSTLQGGFSIETGNTIVDGIVNRGGLQSMMWSISLVMIALALGGIIQAMGLFEVIISGLAKRLKRNGDLVAVTAASSIGVNLLTGEQYLSILLPGQTFKDLFEKFKLHPKNLSRTLEDAGTLVNPLIPWGVSGAFFATTLGVPVLDYTPYAFFLYLSPIITILIAYLNIGIEKLK
ncbi:Na+/H+ antiporter NhaC [Bacillus sp. Marseille-P3661]|uniref:Na+/H+ antiporter NhaC n=1 Tax=Bacillus sp. Marseille-P3661 TaxID=1936234 RepID=UPI000C8657D1|nr:Na+/H+ antiporter NhaC [Bacillus sp. Marseille-P3661]